MTEQGGWNPAEAGRRAAEEAKRLAASGNPFLNRAATPTQPVAWVPGQGVPVEQQLDAHTRQAVAWVVGSLAQSGMAIPPVSWLDRTGWEAQVLHVAEQLHQQAAAAGQSPTWSPGVVAREAIQACGREAKRLEELAAAAVRHEKEQADLLARQEAEQKKIGVSWRQEAARQNVPIDYLQQLGTTPVEAASWVRNTKEAAKAEAEARRRQSHEQVFVWGLALVGGVGAGIKLAQERETEATRKTVRNGQIVTEPYVRKESGFNLLAAGAAFFGLLMVGRVIAPWVIDHRSALEAAARTGKAFGL
jgi:hypothetical protein